MKTFPHILAILTCVITPLSTAQWVNMTGPYGGHFSSLLKYENKLFVGSEFGGVFRSTTNGESWEIVNKDLENTYVTTLALSENNLIAGLYGNIYISSNYGDSWIQANGMSGKEVNDLAVSTNGTSGTTVFASTWNSGVYRSDDDGVNWIGINNGLPHIEVWSVFCFGGKIFASLPFMLYASTDNGVSWTASGLQTRVSSFTFIGSRIFAGTYSGVFTSADSGLTWTPVSSGLVTGYVFSITAQGSTLFAGTLEGLYSSGDFGLNWSLVTNGIPGGEIYSVYNSGNVLYAGTTKGIFTSTDYGSSWFTRQILSNSINTLLVSGDKIFGGTNEGIYVSTNNGKNWTASNEGLTNMSVNILSLSPDLAKIFAGTESGIFVSTNNGLNWVPSTAGILNRKMSSFAFTPNSTGGYDVFAGFDGAGIYRSTNGGANWFAAMSGLTSYFVTTLTADGEHLFAGTRWGGVYHSSNNGGSWVQINNGLWNINVFKLFISDSKLFAATTGSGMYMSTNQGINWMMINNCTKPYEPRSITSVGLTLFAGTQDSGIYQSTDGGYGWDAINEELPGNSYIYTLAVTDSFLFAGSGIMGVWRRSLSELITSVKEEHQFPGKFILSQNYPNPFNPSTTIEYNLPERSFVEINIFNSLGEHINTLVNSEVGPGMHQIIWDGKNNKGLSVTSGIYFYRFNTDGFAESRKMILVR